MNRTIAAMIGIIALLAIPVMAMAKAHGGGQGGKKGGTHEAAPSQSAYEHAGEKASFQRDSHDMGKHEGQMKQEQDQDRDKDKDKDKEMNKGEEQGEGKEKSKEKDKEKSRAKGEDDSGAGMDQGKKEKAKEQELVKDREMEKMHKQKGGKAK